MAAAKYINIHLNRKQNMRNKINKIQFKTQIQSCAIQLRPTESEQNDSIYKFKWFDVTSQSQERKMLMNSRSIFL